MNKKELEKINNINKPFNQTTCLDYIRSAIKIDEEKCFYCLSKSMQYEIIPYILKSILPDYKDNNEIIIHQEFGHIDTHSHNAMIRIIKDKAKELYNINL